MQTELQTRTAPIEGREPLVLRRATAADREALVEMYRAFEPRGAAAGLPPRSGPEAWLESLREYPNFIVAGEGAVVAHAVLCPAGDAAEVAVFVHQGWRGRGLGKLLLAELVAEARRLGLRRVWGSTELNNVPMLRLAAALGFHSGEEPGEFCLDLDEVGEKHLPAA